MRKMNNTWTLREVGESCRRIGRAAETRANANGDDPGATTGIHGADACPLGRLGTPRVVANRGMARGRATTHSLVDRRNRHRPKNMVAAARLK